MRLLRVLAAKVPTESEVSLLHRCLYEMTVPAAAATGSRAAAATAGDASAKAPTHLGSYTDERFLRVPAAVPAILDALPADGHPMAAFAATAAALSDFSFFRAATGNGSVGKKEFWKPALVDALALVNIVTYSCYCYLFCINC